MTEQTEQAEARLGPLSGLRVIELAGIGPGPVAALYLAQMGADVVRVHRPGQAPDVAWPITMAGRRQVCLDLKLDADRARLMRLISAADVLIDPYRPGVAERLGIVPSECLLDNQRLIFARITGWGQSGPWASMAGHDINYISVTGVLDAIGRQDGPPQIPLNLIGDFGGGTMFLLTGILAALYERTTSGRGQVIDASIVDGVAALSGYIHGMRAVGTWHDERGVNRLDSGAPYYDVYQTSDDKWMAVGAVEPQFWSTLIQLLGVADSAPPQRNESQWPQLRTILADRFAEHTQQRWVDIFTGTDACVTPVLSWSEAVTSPQLSSRSTLTVEAGITTPAPAPRFSRTPGPDLSPAPSMSATVEEILSTWRPAQHET